MGLDFKNAISKSIVAKKEQQEENKVQRLEERIKELELLHQNIEKALSGNVTKVKLAEVKVRDNIRDDIEPEMIRTLAISILEKGQLQPVLITSDRCLISGYRRYNALMMLNEPDEFIRNKIKESGKTVPDDLIAYSLNEKYDEINEDEREELQFIENEERQSLDNFEIAEVFYKQKEKGLTQDSIAKKFNKTKGFVSSILNIRKIDPPLVKLFKEIQLYGASKNKTLNASEEEKLTYNKNKGIIGWNFLYKIASAKDIEEQKIIFLNQYKSLLSNEDLNKDYFKVLAKKTNKLLKKEKLLKNTQNLKKDFTKLLKKIPKEEESKLIKLLNYIEEINNFIENKDF
ncbi:MAG: ParB N-terminal domain-containing protein [Candidatus Sericytochromatia bacterium]